MIFVSNSVATYCDSCHSSLKGELIHIRIGKLSRKDRSIWICSQCAGDLAHKLVEELYEKAKAEMPKSSETLLHVSPPLLPLGKKTVQHGGPV